MTDFQARTDVMETMEGNFGRDKHEATKAIASDGGA